MKRYVRADIIDLSDEDWMTKDTAAMNPNIRPATLAALAEDSDWRIRLRVAQNQNCPEDILVKLADDYENSVLCGVACNPNTPATALDHIAAKYLNGWLRHDSQWETLWAVADNPNTPKEVLLAILDRIQLDLDTGDNMFRWETATYHLIHEKVDGIA